MSSKSRQDLENWLKTIDANGNVLDIGGSQNPIKGRTKSWDVKDYKIFDLYNPHELKQKPDIAGDLNKEDLILITPEEGPLGAGRVVVANADIIFCIEVMEYIWNPVSAFKTMHSFLRHGGILYISFHTLYGLHNPKGEDCLRYTKNAIEKLAKETGFEIEEIVTKTLTPEGRSLYFQFCKAEGMRLDFQNPETYNEGYLCKLRKI